MNKNKPTLFLNLTEKKKDYENNNFRIFVLFAKSAGTVEYTDCFSTEG